MLEVGRGGPLSPAEGLGPGTRVPTLEAPLPVLSLLSEAPRGGVPRGLPVPVSPASSLFLSEFCPLSTLSSVSRRLTKTQGVFFLAESSFLWGCGLLWDVFSLSPL